MKLANIRNCNVVRLERCIHVSGIDKITNKQVILSINTERFDEWLNGLFIRYALPELTVEERRFLLTGSKKQQ